MDRLTQRCDLGLADEENICFEYEKDPEGAYNIFDISENAVMDRDELAVSILRQITLKLADYEDIGTLEELRTQRKKMKSVSREIVEGDYRCSECGKPARSAGYCRWCGQKLY